MMSNSVRGSSADGAPSLQRTLSEPFAASAPAGDGGEVKLLEWEEQLTKRSDEDPSTEVTGYEAETAFGTFYTVEVGAALFHVVYDYKGLGAFETEIAAKAAAQADYEQRIRSALYARPAPAVEVREALESAANWMQRYLDTFGELGDDATQANIDDWHALSASPREMVQESDDGAPGLNWKLSDETKKQIAEIESNQRHAFANLNNIIAGCPSEPSPSSRSETAGEVGLNWQISREAKAQIEEIESNTRNALLNAHKIVAGQLPPSPDCSGCRPSEVQKEDATGGLK